MKGFLNYGWGENGVGAESVGETVALGADTLYLAGSLVNGGLQQSVATCQSDFANIIIQPAPLIPVSNSSKLPSLAELAKSMVELVRLSVQANGMVVSHESGSKAEQAVEWIPVLIDTCESLGIEPIILCDSPESAMRDVPQFAEWAKRCSVIGEVRHAIYDGREGKPAWSWGDTEEGVRKHVRSRCEWFRGRESRLFDGICAQLGGWRDWDKVENKYWKWPPFTAMQLGWVLDELTQCGMNERTLVWGWESGDFIGFRERKEFQPVLKEFWYPSGSAVLGMCDMLTAMGK